MPTTTPSDDLSTALGSTPGVERVYDNVQAQVPAVQLAAIKLALWNTAEEFCIQSTVLRKLVDWSMAGGVAQVDFDPVDASQVVAWVLNYSGLTYSDIIPPSILRDLTSPTPTTTRSGKAWLALKPKDYASVAALPELWSTWFGAMLDGTLSRLYMQLAKPYSSPQLGQVHGRLYRRNIALARDVARRQYSAGPPIGFPYFATGRRASGGVCP